MRHLVLIGMPGSGKTTLATRLARALGREAVDIDARIEAAAGMPIAEIFARYGEAHFRDLESALTAEAAAAPDGAVLSTGGGVVLRAENMAALRQRGVVFFLDRPVEDIAAAAGHERRPLVGENRARIFTLYAERLPLYRQYADHIVPNRGAVETALAEILRLWEESV